MIKRYDMYQDYDMLVKPEEFEGGDWVYYEDHAAELATLRAENDRLAQKLDRAVKHLERAVTLIDDRLNLGGTIQRGYHTGMMRSFIKSCAKEALK